MEEGAGSTNVVKTKPTATTSSFKPSAYVGFLHRYSYLIFLLGIGFMAGIASWAFGVLKVLDQGGFRPPHAESTLTEKYFSTFENLTSPGDLSVLIGHDTWTVDDSAFQDAYQSMKKDLLEKFPISDVIDPFAYPFLSSGLVSKDRHMALMSARFPKAIMLEDASLCV